MLLLLVHSFFLLLLVFWIRKFYQNSPIYLFFTWGFLAKIGAGIFFSWLYLYYYGGGDMQNYFRFSSSLANLAYQNINAYFNVLFFDEYAVLHNFDPQIWEQSRALFFIKILSVFNLLSGGSFWVLANFLSFFSFLGMWHLASTLSKTFPNTKYAALLGFVFFPSVLIWSVGISKESLIMGVTCFSLARVLVLRIQGKRNMFWWFISVFIWSISSLLLLFIKFYYLGILVPSLLAYVFTSKICANYSFAFLKKIVFQIVIFLTFIFIIYYPLSFTNKHLSLNKAMIDICYNHNSTYVFSKQNDLIHYWRINNKGFLTLFEEVENFAKNSPIALYSGLYRPFIWEADNKLKIILSIENSALLILSIITLYFWFRKGKKKYNLLILACLFYIFSLCIILAFSSPNFGTLSRYKVGFMPLLVYLLCIPVSITWSSFLDKKLSFLDTNRKRQHKA